MVFGKLICVELAGIDKHRVAMWRCKCECGNELVTAAGNLTKGYTKSCGCSNKTIKHGLHGKTNIYGVWKGIRARCFRKTEPSYKRYGGRGISVCAEWLEFKPFYDWAISSGYEKRLTIERINNDGNYEPSNCKWATLAEQQNNKRNNIKITKNNQTKTASQWGKELGIMPCTIYSRIRYGWAKEELLLPVGAHRTSSTEC
jgi:hypothetical protein